MSLRTVHLAFILLAIVGADLFGAWAVRDYIHNEDPAILSAGIVSLLGGLGLIVYAFRLVKGWDRANIH